MLYLQLAVHASATQGVVRATELFVWPARTQRKQRFVADATALCDLLRCALLQLPLFFSQLTMSENESFSVHDMTE